MRVLYRYDARIYASLMREDYPQLLSDAGTMRLEPTEYPIIKDTPCGAWVDDYGRKRWVNLEATKKFACRSKDEALASFIARKRRQIEILERQLADARRALKKAEVLGG